MVTAVGEGKRSRAGIGGMRAGQIRRKRVHAIPNSVGIRTTRIRISVGVKGEVTPGGEGEKTRAGIKRMRAGQKRQKRVRAIPISVGMRKARTSIRVGVSGEVTLGEKTRAGIMGMRAGQHPRKEIHAHQISDGTKAKAEVRTRIRGVATTGGEGEKTRSGIGGNRDGQNNRKEIYASRINGWILKARTKVREVETAVGEGEETRPGRRGIRAGQSRRKRVHASPISVGICKARATGRIRAGSRGVVTAGGERNGTTGGEKIRLGTREKRRRQNRANGTPASRIRDGMLKPRAQAKGKGMETAVGEESGTAEGEKLRAGKRWEADLRNRPMGARASKLSAGTHKTGPKVAVRPLRTRAGQKTGAATHGPRISAGTPRARIRREPATAPGRRKAKSRVGTARKRSCENPRNEVGEGGGGGLVGWNGLQGGGNFFWVGLGWVGAMDKNQMLDFKILGWGGRGGGKRNMGGNKWNAST